MSIELKVGVSRVDVTKHFICLNDEQMKGILTRAVAEAAGVDLSASGVRVGRFYIYSQAGSIGTEHRAEVEIIEDNDAARRYAAENEGAKAIEAVQGGAVS